MAFASERQKKFMLAAHPQIAKRWAAKDSAGMPPGKRSSATDFKPLSPGPKARHGISKPAKEQDAMEEGPISFVLGSRGNRLDKFKRKAT